MSRKARLKYCLVCRGPDELMYCKTCKGPYHFECVSLRAFDPDYTCEDCLNEEANPQEEEEESPETLEVRTAISKKKAEVFLQVKEWHNFITYNRVEAIKANRQLIGEPFRCNRLLLFNSIQLSRFTFFLFLPQPPSPTSKPSIAC